MTSLSAVSVPNECASWGDGHLPLVSQFQIFYSALWCWAWHSASHNDPLPPHPLGSASRRCSRETGWLEEGEGSSLFIAVPHTLVVAEGSSLQLLGALPEPASSYTSLEVPASARQSLMLRGQSSDSQTPWGLSSEIPRHHLQLGPAPSPEIWVPALRPLFGQLQNSSHQTCGSWVWSWDQ